MDPYCTSCDMYISSVSHKCENDHYVCLNCFCNGNDVCGKCQMDVKPCNQNTQAVARTASVHSGFRSRRPVSSPDDNSGMQVTHYGSGNSSPSQHHLPPNLNSAIAHTSTTTVTNTSNNTTAPSPVTVNLQVNINNNFALLGVPQAPSLGARGSATGGGAIVGGVLGAIGSYLGLSGSGRR